MRLWAPGWLLSIVGRGHEGRPLFGTDEDRRFFVERLAKVFTADAVDLLAWALPVGGTGAVVIGVARRRGAALLARMCHRRARSAVEKASNRLAPRDAP